jgi:glycosyltransferase involved in cell wall biosynthesis
MSKLSVTIITYNEENNIGRCLQSVLPVADEIIVVDSMSTDRTKEICRGFPVTFFEQPFLGYIEQKNFALGKVSHPYVLSLDADEELGSELIDSIRREKQKGFSIDGYTMNRLNNYCGAWIRHGDYYPDRKLRLWNHLKGAWGGENPHDKVILAASGSVMQLTGNLHHYSFASITSHWMQMRKFSTIAASAMYRKSKKAGPLKPVLTAAWTFLRGYIFKAGFLDGKYGFTIARINAWYSWSKYHQLRELWLRNGN